MFVLAFINIAFFLNINNSIAPDFVVEFHNLSSKKDELNYIEKYKNSKFISIKAYVVSLKMKQAKYKFFPWSKLTVFNKEKKALDQLIKLYPKNVHLRYIRLIIQEKVPSILGYNKHLKEDKTFLKRMLSIKDESDYLDSYILKNTSL